MIRTCSECGWAGPIEVTTSGVYICANPDICRQNQRVDELRDSRTALVEQRDALLAACEKAVKTLELWPESEWGWRERQIYDALTAAIAKART